MIKTYRIEDDNSDKAVEILRKNGFTDIVRMPRLCLYDYEAEKNGKKCYVEVRCRSVGMAPYFTFKRSKLQRLKRLKESTGRGVYVLLFQGDVYRLFEIDDFPSDLKPFKLYRTGKVVTVRFPVKGELTDEEKRRIIEMRKAGFSQREIAETLGRSELTMRRHLPSSLRALEARSRVVRGVLKKVRLVIWCREDVRKAFRRYSVEYKSYEDALIELLREVGCWPKKGVVH